MIKASVIIPAHNRLEQLERAINSVLKQKGADHVEIIVVDDCSDEVLKPGNLRAQDKLIRNNINSGAAISRNVGIDASSGEWIYLLDSDDYFLSSNFHQLDLLDNHKVYYSQLSSGTYQSDFPPLIYQRNFFEFVLYRYPYMCQTSTLSFHKNLGLRFDESLPKHQDWDFILLQCLINKIPVALGGGLRYFDRSDKQSLSRTTHYEKTDVWLEKLKASDISAEHIKYFQFSLQGASKKYFTLLQFFTAMLKYYFNRKIKLITLLKLIYKRLFRQ